MAFSWRKRDSNLPRFLGPTSIRGWSIHNWDTFRCDDTKCDRVATRNTLTGRQKTRTRATTAWDSVWRPAMRMMNAEHLPHSPRLEPRRCSRVDKQVDAPPMSSPVDLGPKLSLLENLHQPSYVLSLGLAPSGSELTDENQEPA